MGDAGPAVVVVVAAAPGASFGRALYQGDFPEEDLAAKIAPLSDGPREGLEKGDKLDIRLAGVIEVLTYNEAGVAGEDLPDRPLRSLGELRLLLSARTGEGTESESLDKGAGGGMDALFCIEDSYA